MKSSVVKGVTILGGEPFEQIMDDDLLDLLKRIKEETECDIWIYSGYTFEQLQRNDKQRAILEVCDVLVDGPFVDTLKNLKLKFRGSSNQRIIDIKETKRTGNICLLEF